MFLSGLLFPCAISWRCIYSAIPEKKDNVTHSSETTEAAAAKVSLFEPDDPTTISQQLSFDQDNAQEIAAESTTFFSSILIENSAKSTLKTENLSQLGAVTKGPFDHDENTTFSSSISTESIAPSTLKTENFSHILTVTEESENVSLTENSTSAAANNFTFPTENNSSFLLEASILGIGTGSDLLTYQIACGILGLFVLICISIILALCTMKDRKCCVSTQKTAADEQHELS